MDQNLKISEQIMQLKNEPAVHINCDNLLIIRLNDSITVIRRFSSSKSANKFVQSILYWSKNPYLGWGRRTGRCPGQGCERYSGACEVSKLYWNSWSRISCCNQSDYGSEFWPTSFLLSKNSSEQAAFHLIIEYESL